MIPLWLLPLEVCISSKALNSSFLAWEQMPISKILFSLPPGHLVYVRTDDSAKVVKENKQWRPSPECTFFVKPYIYRSLKTEISHDYLMYAALHVMELQYHLLRLMVGHRAASQSECHSCSEKENTVSFSKAFAFKCYLVPVTLKCVRHAKRNMELLKLLFWDG